MQENFHHYSCLRVSGETYDDSRVEISLEEIGFIIPIVQADQCIFLV
jgi:hypothetical protein